jgi:hypothetical protein
MPVQDIFSAGAMGQQEKVRMLRLRHFMFVFNIAFSILIGAGHFGTLGGMLATRGKPGGVEAGTALLQAHYILFEVMFFITLCILCLFMHWSLLLLKGMIHGAETAKANAPLVELVSKVGKMRVVAVREFGNQIVVQLLFAFWPFLRQVVPSRWKPKPPATHFHSILFL